MDKKVSAQNVTGIIKLPPMTTEICIGSEWMGTRDELIRECEGFLVTDQTSFFAASDLLKKITKHSKGLETKRKEFAKPFQQAAKIIKEQSDQARDDLEKVKTELSNKIAKYADEQRRIEAEERRKAEAAAREEAERQAALQMAADELGMSEEEEPEEIKVEAAPVARRAVSMNTRISKVIKPVTAPDKDKIPRAFLMVDDRLVNAYIKEHKAELMRQLEELPPEGRIEPVPGLKLALITKVASS